MVRRVPTNHQARKECPHERSHITTSPTGRTNRPRSDRPRNYTYHATLLLVVGDSCGGLVGRFNRTPKYWEETTSEEASVLVQPVVMLTMCGLA